MIPQNVSDIIDILHGDLDWFTCPENNNKKIFLNWNALWYNDSGAKLSHHESQFAVVISKSATKF